MLRFACGEQLSGAWCSDANYVEIGEDRAVTVRNLWWLELNFAFSFTGLPVRRRFIMLRLRNVPRMTVGFDPLNVTVFSQDEQQVISSPIYLRSQAHDTVLCLLGELPEDQSSSFRGYVNVSHRNHCIANMTFSEVCIVDAQIHLDTVGILPSLQRQRIITLLAPPPPRGWAGSVAARRHDSIVDCGRRCAVY